VRRSRATRTAELGLPGCSGSSPRSDLLRHGGRTGLGERSVSIVFFALAAGSILYVVMELLNVGRALSSKTLVTWGVFVGLFLGFTTNFILQASGV